MAATAYTKTSSTVDFLDNSLTNEAMVKHYCVNGAEFKGGDTVTIDKYEGMTACCAEVIAKVPHSLSHTFTASISGNTVTIGGNTSSGATNTPKKYGTVRVTYVKE